MSFSDLVSLESQLNDSLLSVKDQKVETSRLQVNNMATPLTQSSSMLNLYHNLYSFAYYALPGENSIGREPTFAQTDPESSSSDENDKEDHHSDTSLQLGWGKRKKLKIERPAITLEVQVSSD
ncbi:hypothetical protein YC2023_075903 [Brassica napus]